MNHKSDTHTKKSDIIKANKLAKEMRNGNVGKKKSIVKYETELPKENEDIVTIVRNLGAMQFEVQKADGSLVRAKAGNTFKVKKRNPRGERIYAGNLVKIDTYLGIHNINHVYTQTDIDELIRIGILKTHQKSTEPSNVADYDGGIDFDDDNSIDLDDL